MAERLQGPQRIESDNFTIIAHTLSNRCNKRLELNIGMCARGRGWVGGDNAFKSVATNAAYLSHTNVTCLQQNTCTPAARNDVVIPSTSASVHCTDLLHFT